MMTNFSVEILLEASKQGFCKDTFDFCYALDCAIESLKMKDNFNICDLRKEILKNLVVKNEG